MILWDAATLNERMKDLEGHSSCKVRAKDWKAICCLMYSVFSAQKIAFLPNRVRVSVHGDWVMLSEPSAQQSLDWITWAFHFQTVRIQKAFLCHSSWNKTFSLLKINYWVFCGFIIYLCALGNLFVLERRKQHLKRSSGKRSAQLCCVMPFLHADQEVMLSTGSGHCPQNICDLDLLSTMKWKIKRTLMFRMGCYSYAKCCAQYASLKFGLNEYSASLQGAVFCILLGFLAGLIPMAIVPSRGMAGTVAGSCHSPLILASHPQRDKCVQWSVLVTFLLLYCARVF